jgi:hypothetical protein
MQPFMNVLSRQFALATLNEALERGETVRAARLAAHNKGWQAAYAQALEEGSYYLVHQLEEALEADKTEMIIFCSGTYNQAKLQAYSEVLRDVFQLESSISVKNPAQAALTVPLTGAFKQLLRDAKPDMCPL